MERDRRGNVPEQPELSVEDIAIHGKGNFKQFLAVFRDPKASTVLDGLKSKRAAAGQHNGISTRSRQK